MDTPTAAAADELVSTTLLRKPWDAMSSRERDALTAECLGYTILRGVVPNLEAHPLAHWMVFQDAEGNKHNPIPFTTDYAAVALVRAEMARGDRVYHFLRELYAIVTDSPEPKTEFRFLHFQECWFLVNATADQQCHAAVRACGVEV